CSRYKQPSNRESALRMAEKKAPVLLGTSGCLEDRSRSRSQTHSRASAEIQSDGRSQRGHHPAREVDTKFLMSASAQRPRRVILLELAPADARARIERAKGREPERRGDGARAGHYVTARAAIRAAVQDRAKEPIQRDAPESDRVSALRRMKRRSRQGAR